MLTHPPSVPPLLPCLLACLQPGLLPVPAPAVTLESRITYVPQFGYSYELLRRAAGEAGGRLKKTQTPP